MLHRLPFGFKSAIRQGRYFLTSLILTWCTTLVVQAQIVILPGDTIQAKVEANPTITNFILKAGEHRMQKVNLTPNAKRTSFDGITFTGEVDANGNRLTILNGSRSLLSGNWKQRGPNLWVYGGQTQQGSTSYKECLPGFNGCKYPEDIYKNDYPLRHDTLLSTLKTGGFYFDYNTDSVYVYENPTNQKMEIGVATYAFGGSANNVTIKNLIIEKYATPGHVATVGYKTSNDTTKRRNWIIENNEIRLNHGTGVNIYAQGVIRNNYVHHNGQLGIGANGKGGLIENNEVAYNVIPEIGFDYLNEGGGGKFVASNLILRNNRVHDNKGPGLWSDVGSRYVTYEGNSVINNDCDGIFHEISYDAVIRCNTVYGNGKKHGGNIIISTSSNVEVYNNKVTMTSITGSGISIRQEDRGTNTNTGQAYVATNNFIHHNDIIYQIVPNRFQVSGAVAPYNINDFWGSGNNRFNYNHYHMSDLATLAWQWNGDSLRKKFTQFRSYGQEAQGTIDNNLSPTTAPVVNAGPDQRTTSAAGSLQLIGANTGEFTTQSYAWNKQSGPAATLTNATTSTLTISNLVAGTYVFRLAVIDGCGTTAYDDATITVYPPLLTAPANGDVYASGNAIAFQVDTAPVSGTITKVEYYNGTTKVGESTNSPFSYTLPAAQALAGNYAVKAVFTTSGGTFTTETVSFTVKAGGYLIREFWSGLPTSAKGVSSIPVSTTPTSTSQVTTLEGPSNVGDNYGARYRGYIYPPVTGSYTFWIASDNESVLRLSTTANPFDTVAVAYLIGYTTPQQWTKYPTQQSAGISLQAGKRYYIEVLHKEATSGDNLAVGWRTPLMAATATPVVVPGVVLSPYLEGGARVVEQVASAEKVALLNVSPNPATGTITVSFTSTQEGPTSLNLYTADGLLMHPIFEGTMKAGQTKQVEWNGSHLQNGLYILRLLTPGKIQYAKLVFSH